MEFHTNRIDGKFYRFSGTVERGKGHEEKDADYLHLTGNLDIVTVNAVTDKQAVQTVRVGFQVLRQIGEAGGLKFTLNAIVSRSESPAH